MSFRYETDEPTPEREYVCDHCNDMGCAKCDPNYGINYSLAWALDQIFATNLSGPVARLGQAS